MMTRTIPLTKGYTVTVDEEDYNQLAGGKWYANVNQRGAVYARGRLVGRFGEPLVMMARTILGLDGSGNSQVIYCDGDTLNLRRANLRVATPSEAQARQRPQAGRRFKGVLELRAMPDRYYARMNHGGTTLCLGGFDTPEDAARAYDAAATLKWGSKARLNFPLE